MGAATNRIELGTAVMPIQTRHPVAMAQQALANQAVCEGRFTLGIGPSHHWIVEDMLGLPYDRPARQVRDYLEVLNVAFAGPGSGRRGERRPTACTTRSTSPTSRPRPVLVAALAPVMLRIAGELADGTILWMADERAIGDHVVPRITKAAQRGREAEPARRRRRPRRAVRQRRGRRRARAGRTGRSGTPSTRRTTSGCSSTATRPMSAISSPPATRPRCVERLQSLPGCRRHRPRRARAPARRRPRRPHRVPQPHRGVPRFAVPRALSGSTRQAS